MNWTIDRFEGDLAVVETQTGVLFNIPRQALPPQAREGDILEIAIDAQATADKKARLRKRLKGLENRRDK